MTASEYRTTVVCIDSYEKGVPVGRLFSPFQEDAVEFDNLVRFLLKMEELLDRMKLPQPPVQSRKFAPPPAVSPGGLADGVQRTGRLATFAVKVLFRQNASWQGSVCWLEQDREEPFRSALELVFLMNGALVNSRERPTA
jgi:hypothetical protein